MRFKSFARISLIVGVSAIAILVFISAYLFIRLQTSKPKSLAALAKPVIKMDLQAPKHHGWLSDHEIFFLREKNQGDFLCVKMDINDGHESLLKALSPHLRDHEERGSQFEIKSSPSGKHLALVMGNKTEQTQFLHEWKSEQTIELKKGGNNMLNLTWLPDESGWITWKVDPSTTFKGTQFSLDPLLISTNTSYSGWNKLTFPFFPSPPYVFMKNGNLGVLCFEHKKSLSLHVTSFGKQTANDASKRHLMVPKMLVTKNSSVSHCQNGNAWLIAYERSSLGRIRRTDIFPYFRIKSTQRTLELWNLETETSEILDPDIEMKNIGHVRLNPSGTHFSFTCQGRIWVAKSSDFLE